MSTFETCQVTKSGSIVTPRARMSFPNLFTAKLNAQAKPGDKPKFTLSILIPPAANISLLMEAATAAAREKWGDKLPAKLKNPFLKAEEYDSTADFKGFTLIRASAITKPQILGPDAQNITEESEVYPGRWCRVSLRPFSYENSGNRGVSFGLQNVQLLDHDEPLGGRARAEDEFAAVELPKGKAGAPASAESVFG